MPVDPSAVGCNEWTERVSAWLDHEVDDAESAAVEAHLERCTACDRAAQDWARLRQRSLVRPASTGSPDAAVLGEVLKTRARPSRGVRPWLAVLLAMMLAGAAVTMASAAHRRGAPPRPRRPLEITEVQIDRPVLSDQAVVHLSILNTSGRNDRLVAATSPVARTATFHTSTLDRQGRTTMLDLTSVEIPDGGYTLFQSGGIHIMLGDLRAPLRLGERVPIDLTFSVSGHRRVIATVVPIGSSLHQHHG